MAIEPMGPVVVGVDGSAASFAALELAADEAAARVTPLVVMHACAGQEQAIVPACAPEWVGELGAAQRVISTAVGRVNAEHPGLAVSAEVVTGDPADCLITRAADACLVVLGHRDRGGLDGVPVSGVALRVAARAPTPVLVHRPLGVLAAVESPRPVLVGVDAEAGSDALIEFAFAEADLRGAPLVALHVWSRPAGSAPAGLHPPAYDYADARDEADRMLAEALAGWSDKYPDVSVRREVRHGLDVVQELRDASAAAQLVVVGRSHRSQFVQLLLGSVSRAMVQRGSCPVAVVP